MDSPKETEIHQRESIIDQKKKLLIEEKVFFFFRILNIFNTHTRREEKTLKKLIVVYIQKIEVEKL